jgi:HK97 family phage prohead protease
MTDIRHLVAEIDGKAVSDDGPGEITGYAATYGNVDLQDDLIERGAFDKTLSDLAGAKARMPLLDWHQSGLDKIIGSVLELRSTPLGLWFRAAFTNDAQGQRARQLAKDGHLSGVSIGYQPIKVATRMVAGRLIRVLKEVRIHEISLTPVPANPEAQLIGVKTVGEVELDIDADALQAELEDWAARQAAGSLLEDAELAGLESWAIREGGDLTRATPGGLRHLADVLDLTEADVLAKELESWASSPEVRGAMHGYTDESRVIERRQLQRRQANDYSLAMARHTSRGAGPCGACRGCRLGLGCDYDQ